MDTTFTPESTPHDPWAVEALVALQTHAPRLVWLCVANNSGDWKIYGKLDRNDPGMFTIKHAPAAHPDNRWHMGYTHDDYGSVRDVDGVGAIGCANLVELVALVVQTNNNPAQAFVTAASQ